MAVHARVVNPEGVKSPPCPLNQPRILICETTHFKQEMQYHNVLSWDPELQVIACCAHVIPGNLNCRFSLVLKANDIAMQLLAAASLSHSLSVHYP